MSKAKEIRALYAANRLKVISLLGWNEQQYGQFQYDMGLLYMSEVLGLDKWAIQYMERSRMYWKWWINHWNLHDANVFLPAAEEMSTLSYLQRVYCDAHSPRFLMAHPSDVVMQETYDIMVCKMNRRLTKTLAA